MYRSVLTRLLHLFLAVAIIHQLVVSQFMSHPRPGRPGDFGYTLHEYVGLASMGVIILYWLWTVLRRREHNIMALVPWFNAERRRAVFVDTARHLEALRNLSLPLPAEETPLASAVHGLGLLAATLMAVTGTIAWFLAGADGMVVGSGRLVLEVHETFANVMWAYLVAHAALALLHEWAGHRTIRRMFSA